MNIITLFSIAAIIGLGILSSTTDVRFHKVKNGHIVFFACLGLVIQAGAVLFDASLALPLIENLLLAVGVAIAFYAAKIWAAGDAKLFATMAFLAPCSLFVEILKTVFPSLLILGFTFTIAMLYVAVESVAFFLRDIGSHNLARSAPGKKIISKTAVSSWISAYIIIDFADSLIKLIGKSGVYQSPLFLAVFNLLIANACISLMKKAQWKIIISGSVLAVRIVLTVLRFLPPPSFSVWTIVIITVLLLFRRFTGQYDYRVIPTETVAEGQVLAQSTIALFLLSDADHLPSFSDESTRCRLTADEAESIRTWGKTRNGKKTIVIVRNLPFAPFIFAGVVVSVAICALM